MLLDQFLNTCIIFSGIFRNVDFKCERRGINSPRLSAAIPFSVSGLVVRFSVFCLISLFESVFCMHA